MELYNYFRSSASYRVRIALALKGLAYDYKSVHLANNEQFNESYASVSAVAPGAAAARRRTHADAVAGDHRIPRRNAPRAAAAAQGTAGSCARARAVARHRLRDPPAEQPAGAALSGARSQGGRRRQGPLVPPLGRDRARGGRTPARGAARPLLPRRDADHGRLLPGAADLQRAALQLPHRSRAEHDARVRGLHGADRHSPRRSRPNARMPSEPAECGGANGQRLADAAVGRRCPRRRVHDHARRRRQRAALGQHEPRHGQR